MVLKELHGVRGKSRLKTEYRAAKDNNGKTGRGQKTFSFYKEIDEVLGHRPVSKPPVLLDTSAATPTDLNEANGKRERDEENGDDDDGKHQPTISLFNSYVILDMKRPHEEDEEPCSLKDEKERSMSYFSYMQM